MYNSIKESNAVELENYSGRDRVTGKRKMIDYSQYDN